MNKILISLAFTIALPLSQVAVAQEIIDTFSDTEIAELKSKVCNSTEVNSILSSNEPYKSALDDVLVANSTGNYTVGSSFSPSDDDDDDDDDGGSSAQVISSNNVDQTIMPDPTAPSAQQELSTNICL